MNKVTPSRASFLSSIKSEPSVIVTSGVANLLSNQLAAQVVHPVTIGGKPPSFAGKPVIISGKPGAMIASGKPFQIGGKPLQVISQSGQVGSFLGTIQKDSLVATHRASLNSQVSKL